MFRRLVREEEGRISEDEGFGGAGNARRGKKMVVGKRNEL